ncbi:MAG TPA: prepilin-type N-terminal cleavage/methylation domain-containing protein, partial [Candidatus Saccharibacteria bacterium]|nr:prepilin-type N-terminal cleavage/methylation domain-containing protein [Candidatus Saccharibacteria bacterium]
MGIGQKYIRGFTIVELLIVIVIIGILATVTAIVYSGIQANARDTSVLSDLDTMDGLQTSYSLKNGGNAKPYYSGNGPDTELDFAPSGDNVIDVVVNGDDYCIRGYNTKSSSYKTLSTEAIKESSSGVCGATSPSQLAMSDSIPPIVWTEDSYTSGYWIDIASSSDGIKLAAAEGQNGYVATSTNGGAEWVTWHDPVNVDALPLTAIASSSDGNKLAVTTEGGYIYNSIDGGINWVERTTSGSRYWTDIASSNDGNKLAAVANNGYIYTSSDGGATWVERTTSGIRTWQSIASSSDGNKLAAVGSWNYIYTSSDGGATWVERATPQSGV